MINRKHILLLLVCAVVLGAGCTGYSPDTQAVDIDGDTNIVFELDSHHLSPQPNESEANSSSGPNASEPNESGMNATAA